MKRTLLALMLALNGCAVAHMPDSGGDAGLPIGADAGPYQNPLCETALRRHAELNCANRPGSYIACPLQWDGNESCDDARGLTCLEYLEAATDCPELRIRWHGECLPACTPTTP